MEQAAVALEMHTRARPVTMRAAQRPEEKPG
jgi:hypothetical protein